MYQILYSIYIPLFIYFIIPAIIFFIPFILLHEVGLHISLAFILASIPLVLIMRSFSSILHFILKKLNKETDYLLNWEVVLLIFSFDYLLPLWKYIGLDISQDSQDIIYNGYMKKYKIKTNIPKEYKVELKTSITNLLAKLDATIATEIDFICRNVITIHDAKDDYNSKLWRERLIQFCNSKPTIYFMPIERYNVLTQFIEDKLLIPDKKFHQLTEKYKYDLEHDYSYVCDTPQNKIIFAKIKSYGIMGHFINIDIFFTIIKNIGDNYRLLQFWIEFTETFEKEEVEAVTKWIKKGFDSRKINPPPFLQHLV